MIKKNRLIFLLGFIFSLISCNKRGLAITDVVNADRRFKDRPEYELAKAVQYENVELIIKICNEKPAFIESSYKDKKYSVLHFACELEKEKSVKALLELGFNPNTLTYYNETPMMVMFDTIDYMLVRSKVFLKPRKNIIKLLIDYGIDCNLAAVEHEGRTTGNNEAGLTPLMVASNEHAVDCVEFLIEEGNSDVNMKTQGGVTAAIYALGPDYEGDIKTAHSLICKYHADVTGVYFSEGKEYKPVQLLRKMVFPLKSKEYKLKQEVIKEFASQGIDYYAEPVPEFIEAYIKSLYPNTWEEYIKVY